MLGLCRIVQLDSLLGIPSNRSTQEINLVATITRVSNIILTMAGKGRTIPFEPFLQPEELSESRVDRDLAETPGLPSVYIVYY